MDQSNFAPTDADPLMDRLAEQYAALRTRTAELAAALDRVPAKIDETTIDKATGFVKDQVRKCAKAVGEARKAEKADFLEAGRKVDAFFTAMADQLDAVAKEVERRMQVYLTAKADEERRRRQEEARKAQEAAEAAAAEARRVREEEDRKAREAAQAEAARIAALTPSVDPQEALAAQRAAAEAAEKAERDRIAREAEALQAAARARQEAGEAQRHAEVRPSELARTRGALGGTATLVTNVEIEIVDLPLAARSLAHMFPEDVVKKAARGYQKAFAGGNGTLIKTQPVPGIRFYEDSKARVT